MARWLAAVAGLVAVAAAPALAQTPERAQIAFTVTVTDGHSELFLMRSDGSERRRLTGGRVPLTKDAPRLSEPSWSPDGTKLAFSWERDIDSPTGSIRTLDLASGHTTALTSGHLDFGPDWSPDGSRIAFSRHSEKHGNAIYAVPAQGGPPTPLTTGTSRRFDVEPAWSPDGSTIAFTRVTYRLKAKRIDQDVFVAAADGSGAHRIAAGTSPAWSPDGARIAFVSDRDHNGETCFEDCFVNSELYVMGADGSVQQRLTNTKGDERSPAWSPDGSRIAFDSDRNSPQGSDGGGRELYSIGADGSCMTWLSNSGVDSSDPAWQPGAGRATDPGPGCGATARPPSHDIDVSLLSRPGRVDVYWLGQEFGNLLLSGVSSGRQPFYTDCSTYRPCSERIELQNTSICRLHPFAYGGGRGGGEDFGDGFVDNGTLASRRFFYRGAVVAAYPSSGGWDVYTGETTVHLFGAEDIKALVRALRPLPREQPSSRPLPAPRFPDVFWRKLHRFERTFRRLGSVRAAARELRVTPRAVRDKLALGRLLRRHGIKRHARCA